MAPTIGAEGEVCGCSVIVVVKEAVRGCLGGSFVLCLVEGVGADVIATWWRARNLKIRHARPRRRRPAFGYLRKWREIYRYDMRVGYRRKWREIQNVCLTADCVCVT